MTNGLRGRGTPWNERAPAHARSPGYEVDRFVDDPAHLSEVVRFDEPLLGSITGLRGVHLQCHIGTDTVSLARLGARMTGLDFSAASIDEARRFARRVSADVEFVHAEVEGALEVLEAGSFDLVYTGIGALIWLPSIDRWAAIVAALLRPGGRLFVRDGHPMMLALADPADDGRLVVEHPYFERPEPTVWDEPGSYVETDVELRHSLSHEWNHGLGEIVTALLDRGMRLTTLVEHQSVPWDALGGSMAPIGGGEWQLADRPWRLPHTFTLAAERTAYPGRWLRALPNGYAIGDRPRRPGRSAMPLELPPLPYDMSALEPYLSAETFEYHYGKHHKTYLDTLNGMIEGTPDEGKPLEEIIQGAEGKLFNNAAQVWNHSLYWASMAPGGGGAPSGAAGDAVDEAFGSYDQFRQQFKDAAVTQFGSGWAWLTLDGGKLGIMQTPNADLPMKHGRTAVLTCDVWEHAYYIDYRNKRPDYVEAYLDHLINWQLLEQAL